MKNQACLLQNPPLARDRGEGASPPTTDLASISSPDVSLAHDATLLHLEIIPKRPSVNASNSPRDGVIYKAKYPWLKIRRPDAMIEALKRKLADAGRPTQDMLAKAAQIEAATRFLRHLEVDLGCWTRTEKHWLRAAFRRAMINHGGSQKVTLLKL